MVNTAAITGNVSDTRNLFNTTLLVAFVSMGGILFGYDTGSISGVIATPDFLKTFGEVDASGAYSLTTQNKSLIVSILSLGTFLGALSAAVLGDKFGRRIAISISCTIFLLGVGLQISTNFSSFIVGRILAGAGVGLTSVLGPCYQSETAPKRLRGLLVGGYEGCVTIGLLLAAIVNNSIQRYEGHTGWRITIAVQFAWGVILGVGIFFLPETPRWLLRNGHSDKARRAISRLSGHPIDEPLVEHEFQMIEASLEAEGRSSYVSLFKPRQENKILRRTLTCMALQGLQQLTGINFIFYYGTTFFENSGISKPFTITIITNVVNVVCTVPGLWAIDVWGRRALLFWGAIVMCISQLIVAIAGTVISSDNLAGQRVLIAFVCIYIAGFAATWGPCNWTVTGEIFPLRNRAKGMAIATSTNWLFNWAIGYMTPYLVDTGPGNAGLQARVFFLWGGFCLICAVFVYFCIPETMQLSLEQIDLMWRNSNVRNAKAARHDILHTTPALYESAGEGLTYEETKGNETLRVHEVEA